MPIGALVLQIGITVLLQIGPAFFITDWCKCYYKLGQPNYYKSGQLLHIRATVITNRDKLYYKLGQLLQIGAITTNCGITPPDTVRNYFTSAFQAFYTGTTSSHSKTLKS